MVEILADGTPVRARAGTTVASVLLQMGIGAFRRSVEGEARGPLCGMGVCFECRVTIDGIPHRRACLVPIAPGMIVTTGPGEVI